MSKKIHMHLSVRGAIKNMKKRELASLFTNNEGRKLTADEAFNFLLDELAKGHEVLPFVTPCEGFDYSGGGCQGHELPTNKSS